MRAIIVGSGETGRHVAEALVRERHDVVVIDRDPERLRSVRDSLDAEIVEGNGASPRVLRAHGAGEADLLVAVTHTDEINVVAALIGGQLGTERTVARVRDEDYLSGGESFAHDVLGIDVVIHPERVAAEQILRAVVVPGAARVSDFADGQVTVAELVMGEGAPAAGSTVARATRSPRHRVLGVTRGEEGVLPGPDVELQAEDRVVVAAPSAEIREAVAALVGEPPTAEDAVVLGAGTIGLEVAERLEAMDVHVTIVDSDDGRVRRAAERLRRADVLHRRVVGGEDLEALGVARADVLVACTGDDQANLLAAVTGRQLGIGLAVPVIAGPELVPLMHELRMQSAIMPRRIAATTILSLVRGTHVVRTMDLVEGQALVELRVDERSSVCGSTIGEADLPGGATLGAIVREGQLLEPREDERLSDGDRALVLLADAGLEELIAAFGG